MLSVTFSPTFPRSLLIASLRSSLSVGWPSIFTIWSPGRMPALKPGVSSIGETTMIRSSRIVTTTPSPPKRELVSSCMSLKSSVPMNCECGSRLFIIPRNAAWVRVS